MLLNSLLIRNFRNFTEENVSFHPNLNLVFGENAQGKTNLLEAIAYLSLASSFRQQKDDKILGWKKDFFYLNAEFTKNGENNLLSAGYNKKNRLWKKNQVVCKKLSEIAGFLHTVVFIPEDLEIVKKGPEIRRHFLDREMLQIFSGYHLYLNNYKKALQQRNNLLKQLQFKPGYSSKNAAEMLLPWEEELAKSGGFIILKRWEIIGKLNIIAKRIQAYLTGNQENLELVYEGSIENEFLHQLDQKNLKQVEKVEKITEVLKKKLAENRPVDLKKTVTTLGVHRDDFKIFINGAEARAFGSQGQQRTAALALKLSEVELVYELKGYYPILLLDDVFSELDTGRRIALMELMFNKAQIFITTTEIKDELKNLESDKYAKFKVKQGKIIKEDDQNNN